MFACKLAGKRLAATSMLLTDMWIRLIQRMRARAPERRGMVEHFVNLLVDRHAALLPKRLNSVPSGESLTF
jgi:hypothetical protein